MAAPEREVYVMVGDGSYLMMSAEIITSVQEGQKLTIVLVDNSGFSSIGALSRSVGTKGFGTQYRYRTNGSIGLDTEESPGDVLPVDLAANAESLGAHVIRVKGVGELKGALAEAKNVERTVLIHIPVDRYEGVPDYESFWDVPVAEVSGMETVGAAYEEYARNRQSERRYLRGGG
jgi:3D-(3,5/4)-trihydroxycyclohexane-1,2-dione acylhydrolase (decyclizing)